jgi:hypothetical protein
MLLLSFLNLFPSLNFQRSTPTPRDASDIVSCTDVCVMDLDMTW